MLTVAILINGQPLTARSATNTGKTKRVFSVVDQAEKFHTVYHCDDGTEILHDPSDGAVKLAHLLLDRIKEYESET